MPSVAHMRKEKKIEPFATLSQFLTDLSFKVRNTMNELCWHTKANDIVPIPTNTDGFNIEISLCLMPSSVEAEGAAMRTISTRAISAAIDNMLVHDKELRSFKRQRGRITNIDTRAIVKFLLASKLFGKNSSATIGIVSPITTRYAIWAP